MGRIISACFLLFALLSGCGQTGPEPPAASAAPSAPVSPSEPPTLAQDERPSWVACRIVDGAEEGELLLAELDHELAPHEDSRHDGRSVYRLSPEGLSVYLDGERAQASDLRDGMNVELSFNGTVLETFPAQLGEVYELHAWSIGTKQCPAGGLYDLCGLYLQVLDDLWEKDPGLNSDITLAGLDLSQAPGELLESERAALCWRFGERHGVEVVPGTYEELAEQGYLTRVELSGDPGETGGAQNVLYEWRDGCLFSITADEGHEEKFYSLPVLFFNGEKWRSPLGSYFFQDCHALWPESGTWSGYTVGSEAIS